MTNTALKCSDHISIGERCVPVQEALYVVAPVPNGWSVERTAPNSKVMAVCPDLQTALMVSGELNRLVRSRGERPQSAVTSVVFVPSPNGAWHRSTIGKSKLTEAQVREMRLRIAAGEITCRTAARLYGVSRITVYRIAHGIDWAVYSDGTQAGNIAFVRERNSQGLKTIYEEGRQAGHDGKPRMHPFSCHEFNQGRIAAWLRGFDDAQRAKGESPCIAVTIDQPLNPDSQKKETSLPCGHVRSYGPRECPRSYIMGDSYQPQPYR